MAALRLTRQALRNPPLTGSHRAAEAGAGEEEAAACCALCCVMRAIPPLGIPYGACARERACLIAALMLKLVKRWAAACCAALRHAPDPLSGSLRGYCARASRRASCIAADAEAGEG
jgi:hypothetical protein